MLSDKQESVQETYPSIQQFTGETVVTQDGWSKVVQGLDALLGVLWTLEVVKHSSTYCKWSRRTTQKGGHPPWEVAKGGVQELCSSVEVKFTIKGSTRFLPFVSK